MELNTRVDVKMAKSLNFEINAAALFESLFERKRMPGKMVVSVIVIQKWTNAMAIPNVENRMLILQLLA